MPYREEDEALRSRYRTLKDQVSDARTKKEELEDATRELKSLESELDGTRARLARHLPILERAKLASPCNVPWDDMVGSHTVRFCGKCAKNVYNVIAMSRDEAETMLREASDGVCMRLYRRKDGTVLTGDDCPVGAKRKRRRRLAAAGVMGVGMSFAALTASPYQGTATVGNMGMPPLAEVDHSEPTPPETWVERLDAVEGEAERENHVMADGTDEPTPTTSGDEIRTPFE